MLTLTIISALIIASYTAAVCIKVKGIPYSISATFYALEHKWLFCATMIITAGLLMPVILQKTPESYQFTAFLSCVGMIMVGAAPHFKEGLEKKIHTVGAVLCLLFSQVWVLLTCPLLLLVWLGYLAYTVVMMINKWNGNFISSFILTKPMFWVEITALITTYITALL